MNYHGMIREALLGWYDRNARDLPWRVGPEARKRGVRPDPYRVWLSEIMLQQTTVAAVGPHFQRFLDAFPDVTALAAAPRDAVLRLWAGLGYYSRARNLHAAAQILARDGFPTAEAGWRALPGVGPYTAAAVAAIGFDQATNVVDGNVERVMARLTAEPTPLPGAKSTLAACAARFVTDERPGDWAQALMDLGATVCSPRNPRCGVCPVSFGCRAGQAGDAEAFPVRAPKTPKPVRFGVAFRLRRAGEVLLVRRPDKGLLGGMAALPSTPWREAAWTDAEALDHAPAEAAWRPVGEVAHVFTHFRLRLSVWEAECGADVTGVWAPADSLEGSGLPTVFLKAARATPAPSSRPE